MEQYGNEHYNVERVLRENINGHEYMRRTAREMSTWDEVVEEIYRTVDHVEPWMSGNVRGPSTAFCLLYRLFEIKLTEDQVVETITCKDSPYIRAVGFLYLRYVGDPKDLVSWFEPYFEDSQTFYPSGEGYGKAVTIGEYIRDILLSQNYFETIFTRIPKKVGDEIVAVLRERGLQHSAVGNGGQGGPDRRGGDDGRARPASVKASLSVAMGQRAPNRAGVTEDVSQRLQRREEISGGRRQGGGRPRDDEGHARDGERDRHHDRKGFSWARGDGRGASERSWGGDHSHDRGAERDRERGMRPWGSSGHSSHERSGGQESRDRRGGYDRDVRDSRERDGGRGRDAWNSRDTDRGGRGGHGRERDWRSSRDAFQDRDRDRGRPASSVFGRSAADVFGKCKVPEKNAEGLGKFHEAGSRIGYSAPVGQAEEVVRIGRRR